MSKRKRIPFNQAVVLVNYEQLERRPIDLEDLFNNSDFKLKVGTLWYEANPRLHRGKVLDAYLGPPIEPNEDIPPTEEEMIEIAERCIGDFLSSEIFYETITKEFIDPQQRFIIGNHIFDTKESLKKYLKKNQIKITSFEVLKRALLDIFREKEELFGFVGTIKKSNKPTDGKTVTFYALWHFYQRHELPLNEENKHEYGAKYNLKNGDKLFLDYQTYSEQLNRLNNVKTKTTVKNRIKLLELVQKNLPLELQGKRIKDDLKALESRLTGIIESLR